MKVTLGQLKDIFLPNCVDVFAVLEAEGVTPIGVINPFISDSFEYDAQQAVACLNDHLAERQAIANEAQLDAIAQDLAAAAQEARMRRAGGNPAVGGSIQARLIERPGGVSGQWAELEQGDL